MVPTTRQHLLSRLKEIRGGWVSGGELSRELDISRTAIWKHVCSLRNEGYVIESAPRKGYLLKTTIDRLLPARDQCGSPVEPSGQQNCFRKRSGFDKPLGEGPGHLGGRRGHACHRRVPVGRARSQRTQLVFSPRRGDLRLPGAEAPFPTGGSAQDDPACRRGPGGDAHPDRPVPCHHQVAQ